MSAAHQFDDMMLSPQYASTSLDGNVYVDKKTVRKARIFSLLTLVVMYMLAFATTRFVYNSVISRSARQSSKRSPPHKLCATCADNLSDVRIFSR